MKYLIFLIFFLTIIKASGQLTVRGSIVDSETKETMIAAHVYDSISMKSAISNSQGFYSLRLGKGQVTLMAKYLGYKDYTQTFF